MENETTYYVVMILLIVSFVALFSVYIHNTTEFSLTAMAVYERPQSLVQERSTTKIDPVEGRWDYDGDYKWTRNDAQILKHVLEGVPCPKGKDCDIDNDGRITYNDLSLYVTKVIDSSVDDYLKPLPETNKKNYLTSRGTTKVNDDLLLRSSTLS